MSKQGFMSLVTGILCITAIIIADIITPHTPPPPLRVGETKSVTDPTIYQTVLSDCLTKSPENVNTCRYAADDAPDLVVYYWDGKNWTRTQ